MAIIKSYSPFLNLSNYQTFIVDTNPNSEFFRITEFKETFTGGKNGFLIEGSDFLKETTEIKIEVLDVEGNPIYFEPGKGTPEYYEGLSTLVSVHIYPDTPIGIGKITVLGELKEYIDKNGTRLPVPEDWKGVYNVKWEKTFKINRNLSNEDSVRFYRRPVVSISELVKPIFSKNIPSVTQSGSVEGIALQPIVGSNLNNWSAGTIYKLKINDNTAWTGSVDDNIINIPSLGYSPIVKEVLNNKEILVDIPYSVNNIVQNFGPTPYTTSFEWVEGQTITESALTGSFAKINISNLKTFVGDVARVKVYRKSRNEVTDYQFVQESKLESTELLRDITVSNDTQISYGNFNDFNLSTYWVTSSNDHPVSVNVDVLQSSVKTDYNSTIGGVQQLITSESFAIAKDVEYTLSFKTLFSGSLKGSEYIKAYLSSSDYQQTFLTVSGSDVYKTRQSVTQNIIANPISTSNTKLVFDISGSDWYVSDISLKNAQETSFSPDEFVLIQDIPRKLISETFDFKFEFYDINNNYIPVDVLSTAVFNGGNDFPTSTKILTIQSDRNAFRFVTGSHANPHFQQIGFTTTRQNIVGDVTYGRSVYDSTGNYISEADYLALGGTEYPGALHSYNNAGFVVQIDEFSGSLDVEGNDTFRVGFITYTASADGLEDYETIYRLEDGDNAPGIFVSSTANQFIYKATDLSLNPSSQTITFDLRRKNLGTLHHDIEVNSGSEYGIASPLTLVNDDPTTQVATYSLAGSIFDYTSGSATYYFSASDDYGVQYTDSIKITPIKILDGISVILSNENATLPAKSTGFVESGSFVLTSGSVSVNVGNETILFDDEADGQGNNTFAITSVSGSTGITVNSLNPTTNLYGITALNGVDSGSINVVVRYKDGAGDTTDIPKVVTYSKAKKATPTVIISANPQSQTVNSNSSYTIVGTPSNVTISVNEGGTNYTYGTSGINTFQITNVTGGGHSGTNTYITPTTPTDANGTSGVITISYINSEGTSVTGKTINFNVGVAVQGDDGYTPQLGVDYFNGTNGANGVVITQNPTSQTVKRSTAGVYATPANISVSVTENGSAYTYSSTLASNSTFKISGVSAGSTNNNDGTILPKTPTTTAGLTITFSVEYKTSAGVLSSAIAQSHIISVTLDGVTGPGVVHTGVWQSGRAYQYSDGLVDGTGRRDVVLWSPTGASPYDTYYAATRSHTSVATNTADGSPSQPSSTAWLSLGTQDFFVAAKIGVFEESYVQETLNIGTNNNGGVSSANITLNGGTNYPYISIGQSSSVGSQGYNVNGIFIGSVNDGGTKYKLSLKSDTNSLLWDGTNLSVYGGGTFTGALSGGTISIGSGNNIFKADGNGIYLGNSTFSSAPFRVSPAGVLTATSGTFSGDINGGTIHIGGDDSTSFHVDSAGRLWLGAGNSGFDSAPFRVTAGGSVVATDLSLTGGSLTIGSGGTYSNISSGGKLTAANVDVSGRITATEGFIGDWVLTGPNLYASVGTKKLQLAAGRPAMELYNGSSVVVDVNANTSLSDRSAGSISPSPTTLNSYNEPIYYAFYDNHSGNSYSYTNDNDNLGPSQSTFTIPNDTNPATTLIGKSCTISALVSGTGNYFRASGDDSHGKYLQRMEWRYSYGFKLVTPSGTTYVTTPVLYSDTMNIIGSYQMDASYGTFTISTTVTLEAGTYYITPILNNVYALAILSSPNLPGPAEFQVYMRTPLLSSISAAVPVSKTELCAGGFQVVYDTSKYLEVKRANETDFVKIGGGLTVTGDVTANTSSDIKLKENLVKIENPLEKVSLINGYTYDWKEGFEHIHTNKGNDIGVIAQEIEQILPQLVTTRNNGFKAVRYDKIVALLIEGIKELTNKTKELENEIKQLKEDK